MFHVKHSLGSCDIPQGVSSDRYAGGFMPRNHSGNNIERSEFYGAMQRIVDTLYWEAEDEDFTVRRLDVIIAAEAADLPEDLTRIVSLLPPGNYSRQKLCDQINSAITGHAWGQVYGTVQ